MSVRVEHAGPVTTVVLDRPEVKNAIDPSTARALYDAFVAFDDDAQAQVAVLCGAGDAFCAGFDLSALARGEAEAWLREVQQRDVAGERRGPGPLGPTRLELHKPVIAAVAGPAVAGGLELALWCDLRVMESDAYVGVYCRRWGVPLIDGGTVRLPRLIGEGRAADIILTGRRVDADEALRIGLCERVVPPGQARAAAEALAREIAAFPPTCLRADRRSLRTQHALPLADALRAEFLGGLAVAAGEALAGAQAFAARAR